MFILCPTAYGWQTSRSVRLRWISSLQGFLCFWIAPMVAPVLHHCPVEGDFSSVHPDPPKSSLVWLGTAISDNIFVVKQGSADIWRGRCCILTDTDLWILFLFSFQNPTPGPRGIKGAKGHRGPEGRPVSKDPGRVCTDECSVPG